MTPATSRIAGASAAAASIPTSSALLAAAVPPSSLDRYGLFPIDRIVDQLYAERATYVSGCEQR